MRLPLPHLDLDLECDGEDWVPTPHGLFLAETILERRDLVDGLDILELGAGTALHTVLLERMGARTITATERTESLLETTRRNVIQNGAGDRIRFMVADWLEVEGDYDMICANPPFAKSGRDNRRHFIEDLIHNSAAILRPGGSVLYIQSSMADLELSRQQWRDNGYTFEVVATREGPWRDYYYDLPGFLEEARAVEDGFRMIDGKEHETLSVCIARRE